MTSVTSMAVSVVESFAGFNSAAVAAIDALEAADITLMAIGSALVLIGVVAVVRRGWQARQFGPLRRFEPGPEMLFVPMIVYLVGFAGLHALIARYLPSHQPIEDGASEKVDFAAVLANNMAMVFGAVACWEVGRRCVGTRERSFVLGSEPGGRAFLRGLGGALVAVALCPATLYVTVSIVKAVQPEFVFREHQVINALRDPGRPVWLPWVLWIGVAVVTPIAEELFFRGLVQTALGQVFRRRGLAIGATAILFGLAHGSQLQVVPALFVFGVILGVMYERRGSLIGPIVAHALFNAKTLLWETLGAG